MTEETAVAGLKLWASLASGYPENLDHEYRVIFGDLHGETVTAEQLTQLEAALPK